MSSLTSSSTDAEVEASYDDNASYEEDASVTKCRAFITAARILVRRYVESIRQGAHELERDVERLQGEITQARSWLAANPDAAGAVGGSSVIHPNFDGFRT